jgi:hypothetical protein
VLTSISNLIEEFGKVAAELADGNNLRHRLLMLLTLVALFMAVSMAPVAALCAPGAPPGYFASVDGVRGSGSAGGRS